MDCSQPGSSAYGILMARNPGVRGHFLRQGIFPTEGSNSRLLHLHWQVDSLRLAPHGKPLVVPICVKRMNTLFKPKSSRRKLLEKTMTELSPHVMCESVDV